jgi:hypothetical protein
MFQQTQAFPFPMLVGVLDDGSDSLNAVRDRVSFTNSIRFVNDPMVLSQYPCENNQITIGFINKENELAWELVRESVQLQLAIVSENANVPENICKAVIPDTIIYQSSKNIPSSIQNIVLRTAYLLSISHLAVSDPFENEYVNVCDTSIFHKTVWVTNVYKTKNYDDRRTILKNLQKLIQTNTCDEYVVFGIEEYLTKITGSNITKVPVKTQNGVQSIKKMLEWIYQTYPKDTVVFMVRQEATQMKFTTTRSASRMSTRSIAVVNPFVLPDIPDPRPELYQRGDPRAICGYVMKIDEDTDLSNASALDQCSLYSSNHHQLVMGEMMMRRYRIGNGSRQLGIAFPTLKQFVLDKAHSNSENTIICPETPPISFYKNTLLYPGKSVSTIQGNGFEIAPLPGVNKDGPLETRTLLNMANKTANRSKYHPENLLNDTAMKYSDVVYKIYSGNNIRFRRGSWVHNKEMVSQDYWGNGVISRDTGFLHNSVMVENATIIPYTSMIDQVCKVLLNENDLKLVIDTNPNEDMIFKGIHTNVECVDFTKVNVYGGNNCTYMISHTRAKDLGFSPVIVRMANRKYHETMNVDIEMMKMLGETNGIIVGSVWSELILEIVNEILPDIRWKIVSSFDNVKPEDFGNASYVIGTQEQNIWFGSMFVHHEHCKIVEIAYEHDTNSHWYHLARGVGAEYNVLPLKNEPKKRCITRIRNTLKHYLL